MLLNYNMSDIIRIPNIENYTQEILNGELILTPKPRKAFLDTVNIQTTTPSVPSASVPKLGTRLIRLYDKV